MLLKLGAGMLIAPPPVDAADVSTVGVAARGMGSGVALDDLRGRPALVEAAMVWGRIDGSLSLMVERWEDDSWAVDVVVKGY